MVRDENGEAKLSSFNYYGAKDASFYKLRATNDKVVLITADLESLNSAANSMLMIGSPCQAYYGLSPGR